MLSDVVMIVVKSVSFYFDAATFFLCSLYTFPVRKNLLFSRLESIIYEYSYFPDVTKG